MVTRNTVGKTLRYETSANASLSVSREVLTREGGGVIEEFIMIRRDHAGRKSQFVLIPYEDRAALAWLQRAIAEV